MSIPLCSVDGLIAVPAALFDVISCGRGSVSIEQLVQFLEQIVQVKDTLQL